MKRSFLLLAFSIFRGALGKPFSKFTYERRQKADIVKDILELIGDATNTEANAWVWRYKRSLQTVREPDNPQDYKGHPTMCEINMSTKNGGNCHADITCSDGNKRDYDNWGGCAHTVTNNFNDPGIGPFSVTFTKKDDDCSDGLCGPVLALADVGDYHAVDVEALSEEAQKNANSATLCKVGCDAPTPESEPNEKNICERTNTFNNEGIRSWKCGMPAVGQNYGPGTLDSQGPINSAGYASGWCGVHVVQYQKKDPAADPAKDPAGLYHLDVTIFDNNQDQIGQVIGAEAPAGKAVPVTSKLPFVLDVTAQNVDADPVSFAYSDQSWAYADVAHHCNFGAYDSGNREGDCGFSC
ncbi:MAG: hypothetical protein LQ342_001643 [Letrouitia transgressa]|nr:MAG: hypothetical protein LQ342_001643 [Letrouitia transgressa]